MIGWENKKVLFNKESDKILLFGFRVFAGDLWKIRVESRVSFGHSQGTKNGWYK